MSSILRRMFPAFPVAQLGPNPVDGRIAGVGGAPVGFTGGVGVTPGGPPAVINTQVLQSGFRTPYLIDEIRISMYSDQYLIATPPNHFAGMSGLVKVKFQTGQYAFSKDLIPVGMYAPLFSQYDYGEVYAGQSGISQGRRAFSNIRWMLPKPLIMPAGDVVQAIVDASACTPATTQSITFAVVVTYIGRLIAPGTTLPDTRFVPWVSYMQLDAAAGSTPGLDFKSSSNEFANPFRKDLHVQRFTARTFKQTVQGGLAGDVYNEEASQFQHYTTSTAFFETRIDDSLGYEIVKQFTPVGEVFDTSRHAWNFGRPIGARQQFNVQLRTGFDGTVVPADTQYTQMVGMVGYREERV